MNLCKDCRFYFAKQEAMNDECRHDKSYRGGVRVESYFSCNSMLSGICQKNTLFEPRIETHDDKPDERADRHISTGPSDLGADGKRIIR